MKEFKKTLTNTWESLDNIVDGYYDGRNITNPRTDNYLEYLLNLNEFDRKVFLLYAEYNSYRKVAKETNRSYFIISQIVNRIKGELMNL